jgi:cell division protease FtsH
MSEGNGPTQNPGNGSRKPAQPPPPPKMWRSGASWVVLFIVASVLVMLLQRTVTSAERISISQFNRYVQNQSIESVVIMPGDGKLKGRLRPSVAVEPEGTRNFEVIYPATAIDDNFVMRLQDQLPDAEVKADQQSPLLMILLSMLPWLLIFAFLWFVIFRQLRGAGGAGGMLGNFGRSRHRITAKEHTNITFADVAGVEEAKEEVREIIEFLKSPKKFARLGARIPRGVLLVGEPGCGKTLLAKAIAGEADVPFLSISGSDFVEMFVGVGASRVRDLFKQAKENSPCIIFLDEIDAVGRRRGANFGGGGHDEREQTLNAILVEMDGFDTNTQVIVIAATNRVDVLDPALIRPGRFDRQVFVPLPDVQGRYEILKVHCRKVKLGPTVDIRRIARGTPMFSGAELEALVNESALIATMNAKEYIDQDDLEEARDKVRWGRARKSRAVDERDKKITAYHEAGHAVIQALEKDADPLHKVSIIPRGPMGGATFSLPDRDRMVYTKNYLLATMRTTFGGRIAEEVFFNEISSGASSDIRQATMIARGMVRDWGMGDTSGFVFYGEENRQSLVVEREYSDKTAEMLDIDVKRIMDQAYAEAKRTIVENRDKVELVAQALLKYETITGEEVNALIRGESLDRATVADLLDSPDAKGKSIGTARPIPADGGKPGGLEGGTLPQPS